MSERAKIFASAAFLAVGTMFTSDVLPARAGGGACIPWSDPLCEGDWPYGYSYRPGVKTHETDRFVVRTKYPSGSIRVESKTRFLGLWPNEEGIMDAEKQIQGMKCNTLEGPITIKRNGNSITVIRVSNPNCQLNFGNFT